MFNRSQVSQAWMTKLKSFRSKIDYIKASTSDDEPRADETRVAHLIEEVEDKFSLVEGRCFELMKADEGNWFYLKELVDNAWQEATSTIDRIRVQLAH